MDNYGSRSRSVVRDSLSRAAFYISKTPLWKFPAGNFKTDASVSSKQLARCVLSSPSSSSSLYSIITDYPSSVGKRNCIDNLRLCFCRTGHLRWFSSICGRVHGLTAIIWLSFNRLDTTQTWYFIFIFNMIEEEASSYLPVYVAKGLT